MELWSIRNPLELDIIYSTGTLITNESLIDPDYISAYDWMAAELDARVKRPYKLCRYPVWLWKCWDAERSCKPDLRVRWGRKNEDLILLRLDIPDNLLLLSEFHLWHYALNGWYLPTNESDESSFEEALRKDGIDNKWPFPEPYHSMVVRSWRHMFAWEQLDSSYHGSNLGSSIQAVCWEIKREWILEVSRFRSK